MRLAKVDKVPYRAIVETIAVLQAKFQKASVRYNGLRIELTHRNPPIEYETDEVFIELCKAMAQMAPGSMFASSESVELDQSINNVVAAIEAAMKEYPLDEQ